MSVTRPSTSSKATLSPIFIGWVTASWTPATMLAIVCWAAKPMISPSTAVEARIPVASRFSSVNWLSTIAAITRKMTSASRRRRIRNLVLVERETCETAGDMAVKLNGSERAVDPTPASPTFPYSNWGPLAALVGVPVAVFAGVLLSIPALIAENSPSGELGDAATAIVQLATAIGFALVPFALAMRRGAPSVGAAARRLGLRGFRPSALLWLLAAIFTYFILATIYVVLFGEPKQEDIAKELGPLAVQIPLIAIAAPISEEICFRGMLFGGLRERLPSLAAALISGLVFGVLHAPEGISVVPPLVIFGTVLALLYERTGSIVPGILLHMLNNSIALLGQ
jgi:CAAX protease family protein